MKSPILFVPLLAAGACVLLLGGCSDSLSDEPHAGGPHPFRAEGRGMGDHMPRGPGESPPNSSEMAGPAGRFGDAVRPRVFCSAIDTDHDGSLSMQEIDAAPAVLRKMDRNNDGVVTDVEFIDAVRPQGYEANPETRTQFAESHEGRGMHPPEGHGMHRPEGFPPHGPPGQGPRGQGRRGRGNHGWPPPYDGDVFAEGHPGDRPPPRFAEAPEGPRPDRSGARPVDPATSKEAPPKQNGADD